MVGPQALSETSAQVLEMADQWQAAGRRVAIATVVATWGSSPRPVGSQLLVDEQGEFLGSVSGGCIEGAVVHEARAVIADDFLRERRVVFERLRRLGVHCLDVSSASLGADLVNRYLEIKRHELI